MTMAKEVQKLEGDALTTEKPKPPLDVFRDTLVKQRSEFIKVLPQHITFEKFQRTVMTAIITSPDLLQADRQSLLVASLKSATDGLLPDGRDAALVIFNAKGKDGSGKEVWIKKVQYLPMYAGILKKVRQSDELSSVVAHVVYEKDKFEYVLGDNERVIHVPYMGTEDRGEIIAAYCIAKLKDGSIVREVMTAQDIDKVRRTSKSGSMNENDLKYNNGSKLGDPKGIWKQWPEEMARKTVFRRCAKWLPQQIELVDHVFANDESMEVIDQVKESAPLMIEGASDLQADDVIETKQPDLKEAVKASKAKDKKPEAKKEAPKKEEPKPEPEKPQETLTVDSMVAGLEAAKNRDDLYDLWTADYVDAIDAVKKADPQSYERLHNAYKAGMRKYEEA
jgi:phage RecT family recombinase